MQIAVASLENTPSVFKGVSQAFDRYGHYVSPAFGGHPECSVLEGSYLPRLASGSLRENHHAVSPADSFSGLADGPDALLEAASVDEHRMGIISLLASAALLARVLLLGR